MRIKRAPVVRNLIEKKFTKSYLLAGAFELASAVLAGGVSTFVAGAFTGCASVVDAGAAVLPAGATFAFASGVVVSVVAGASVVVSGFAERTEILPVSAGIASRRADSIKATAAPIVTFDNTVAVPRGAKAELDTLLVKSAPASVLPGCNKTAATSTKHERKNIPYSK
jgi:hypothetical protein